MFYLPDKSTKKAFVIKTAGRGRRRINTIFMLLPILTHFINSLIERYPYSSSCFDNVREFYCKNNKYLWKDILRSRQIERYRKFLPILSCFWWKSINEEIPSGINNGSCSWSMSTICLYRCEFPCICFFGLLSRNENRFCWYRMSQKLLLHFEAAVAFVQTLQSVSTEERKEKEAPCRADSRKILSKAYYKTWKMN